MFQQVSLPEFDYAEFGLDDIHEEADKAAVQLALNLHNLDAIVLRIIRDDGPRLMAVRDRMLPKRCWVRWLQTKYEKSWRTAFNVLEICSALQRLQRENPDLYAAAEERLLNSSQRVLLALGSTGDNFIPAVEALLGTKVSTGEQVRQEYAPAKPSEREKILRHVQTWGAKRNLSPEEVAEIQSEACDRAQDLAEQNRRKSPTVADFSAAVSDTIGEELPPVPKRQGSKALAGVTAEGYWNAVSQCQQQRQTILELREAIAELEAKHNSLLGEHEQLLAKYRELAERMGVAA